MLFLTIVLGILIIGLIIWGVSIYTQPAPWDDEEDDP